MADIQNRLLRDPWIEDAIVKRVMPDKLVITITEREPTFVVQRGEQLFYAQQDGTPFAPVGAERFVSLPVLRLEKGAALFRPALQDLVQTLEKKELPFGMADLAWIILTQGNEARMYLQKPDIEIGLDLRSVEMNMRRLNMVWRDLEQQNLLHNVKKVTAFKGKVLVKQR
jgi:cell division protein FtsQ